MPISAVRSLALLPVLLCSLSTANAADADEPLSFGVVPQQAAAELAAVWSPIFRALSERSSIAVGFRTAPDIPTFEQRLAAGQYDLAYMNPYHYTVFHEEPGYLAFAAHPRIAPQAIARLRDAMVAMADDHAGQALLDGIGFAGIEQATDTDWDDVRALQIDLLDGKNATVE